MKSFRANVMESADAALERWIGFATPRVRRAIEVAGWAPDDRRAYCARCGVTVAPSEATETGCGTCRAKPALANGVVRLGSYVDDLRAWVLDVKYRGWAEMGAALGRMLGLAVRGADVAEDSKAIVVVPMPMPWQRRLYRGIDHAKVIAGGVANELDAPLLSLLRKRNGPPQVSLPTSQRRRSGARGLRMRTIGSLVPGGRFVKGSTVVLVDDVCTTGATLRSATRLVRTLRPANVIAALVAVADDPARRRGISSGSSAASANLPGDAQITATSTQVAGGRAP